MIDHDAGDVLPIQSRIDDDHVQAALFSKIMDLLIILIDAEDDDGLHVDGVEVPHRFLIGQILDRSAEYGYQFQMMLTRLIKRAHDVHHVDLVDLLVPVVYINVQRNAIILLS